MNIKSLLLGSAAALIAVSGARAADAVTVAEPEPAEYVKICDVYGSGYFYIPGTETCLRIGGYVRYDIGVGDVGSFDGAKSFDHMKSPLKEQGTFYKNTRFTLKTWTGQETELGTLKTYTETRFNFGNRNGYGAFTTGGDPIGNPAGNKNVSLNFAWIQLGGLRVGKDESAFDTFIGYAGNVINDTLVPYGDFDTNVVQYYFDAGNGFSAVVSLEEGEGAVGTIDSYVPHVVGGLKWTQGWGAISGVVAYDSNYEEVAGKVRLDVNVSNELSLFGIFGYGSDNNLNDPTNTIDAHGRGFYKIWGGNWAFWAGGTYKFNEKTSFNLQVSGDQDKNYGVAANVAYDIVPGFTVTAEVDYDHFGKFDEWNADHSSTVNFTGADKKNSVGGLLRFQRSF
ncbi:porin [Mesorhizobium sp. M2D.F.Ca.ET.185.01.1.1]|uniref:porin n=1 Tax=unclassified Mesorhizobium TaxID=325217 RepID=UPI000FC9B06E|nr:MULTISPECIES: porin [unclassified Mesorhizobium]TGP76377.1 porin [bacterium M00.F.Ca.ET.227.01.1.1]TGP92429.1 porin [bacterium M00.F.Ca.ET.222.01.1.1]TGP96984.1 porin [bacterium M00.F.Ca.ET.221.01.1.1]TGU06556.1 porin [bacterium M00.F.Ca.ET.163.01.1.1]TGU27818.1 porin [bacterium M00.F.Ca.ET.156.01.1.1]TGU50195.1 porin [bacterium M00.F.Ca.ET.146.01.1.1]TGV68156.1 porin [Mesorhizobium sp. M2D.F.Ca.ET.160.01.1.1]TGW13578.1 porin [Mesorhizobium sp. M2D.F.Ca.ET.145.01.1.1]